MIVTSLRDTKEIIVILCDRDIERIKTGLALTADKDVVEIPASIHIGYGPSEADNLKQINDASGKPIETSLVIDGKIVPKN